MHILGLGRQKEKQQVLRQQTGSNMVEERYIQIQVKLLLWIAYKSYGVRLED